MAIQRVGNGLESLKFNLNVKFRPLCGAEHGKLPMHRGGAASTFMDMTTGPWGLLREEPGRHNK